MAGHSRPKDGVASLAYVPAIHVFLLRSPQDVDARHKVGHDGEKSPRASWTGAERGGMKTHDLGHAMMQR
jgi:hypothetical protein